jgi:hypothetical protein
MNFESEESIRFAMLIVGFLLASVFIVVGLMVERFKRYNLIAGYNRATPSEQAAYDIDGLAKHVGTGLETLGVLMVIAALFGYFGLDGWLSATMAVFVLIAFIIPIGARKFMPKRHSILSRLLPEKSYEALERKTRLWLIQCNECGHKRDFWEAGGLRGGGVGEPRKWNHCPNCNAGHWHKVRRKTAEDRI